MLTRGHWPIRGCPRGGSCHRGGNRAGGPVTVVILRLAQFGCLKSPSGLTSAANRTAACRNAVGVCSAATEASVFSQPARRLVVDGDGQVFEELADDAHMLCADAPDARRLAKWASFASSGRPSGGMPWTQILSFNQPSKCLMSADVEALFEYFCPIPGADIFLAPTSAGLDCEVS